MNKVEMYRKCHHWTHRGSKCDTQMKGKLQDTHLIKVQPHYNVWLFCELMHSFQEVHMANVWRQSRVTADCLVTVHRIINYSHYSCFDKLLYSYRDCINEISHVFGLKS